MLKNTFRSLLCLLALVGLARAGEPPLNALTVAQVAQKIHDKSVHVYDCNDPGTFASGHVPGAVSVDYSRFGAKQLPSSKTDTLIFYCMNEH